MADKTGLKIVLVICSSTGDGESPENSLEFFRYLRRETANETSTALSHLFYTVLGLGSSDYSKYQGAPRYLDERVGMLGATKFMERTEADEATSLELVIEPFLESIAAKLVDQVKAVKAITTEVRQAKLEV